ncbi:hypothetical protein [Candidatus Epulonipiscium viviparus]|uniref:hypothetical protein n=1 Tax=Candidatus Epulonipiscium viviparus TaxID=420336 RepID=UPI00016BFEFC|nr:hypothetical protein [Candidatus Epulopiscium viviparus]
MGKVDDLKHLYEEGYRCIYKEKNDGLTLHLKDFQNEKIDTISSHENTEMNEMESFLNSVEFEQNTKGYDIICTDSAE